MRKGSIVITGVSSGIGWGLCQELIHEGYRVFGSVRKQEDADRLQEEWGDAFVPLLFDVTAQDQVRSAAEVVKGIMGSDPLVALVNNAGISEMGPLELLPLERFRRQFEVNVFGIIAVTQAFLPLLGAGPDCRGKPGKILNISSIFGTISYPLMAPYIGSKHAINGITDCLRTELLHDGIDVILVAPGPVRSRVWEKNARIDYAYVAGSRYEEPMRRMASIQEEAESHGMTEQAMGRRIRKIIERRRPRPRYTICVLPLILWILPRFLPTRVLDYFTARDAGLLPR